MNRAIPALIVLQLMAFGTRPSHAQFSPEQTLSHAVNVQNDPSVAMSGSHAVAAWFQSYGNSGIGIAYSIDGGISWLDGGAAPLGIERETAGPVSCCADGAGHFGMAGLVGGDVNLGGSVGFWSGTFVGNTLVWKDPVNIIPPDFYRRDDMFISNDPDRGYYYITYTRLAGTDYEVHFVRSLDGGVTWSPAVQLSNTYSSYARSAVGPDGELYVMWEDYLAQQIVCRRSSDFGATFDPEFSVGADLDNLQTPPAGWHPEGSHIDPAFPDIGQQAPDGPAIAIDRSSGPNRGRIYVAWTDYATGIVGPSLGSAPEVEPDSYFSNANPIHIGQDIVHSVPNGHLGQSDGDVFKLQAAAGTMIWIQGLISSSTTQSPSSVHLYCGEDTTALKLIGRITVGQGQQDPPFIYTLPETGTYWLTTIGGAINPFTETYHLRSYSPQGGAARDHRDIVLVTSSDRGQTWTPKIRVSDGPPGDDESFPALAVDGMGQVHAAWYDRRDSWGTCSGVSTYWSMSRDGGQSFIASHRLSAELSRWECAVPSGTTYFSNLGTHLGLAADGAGACVLWSQANCPDSVGVRAVHVDVSSPTGVESVTELHASPMEGGVALSWRVSDPSALLRCLVVRTSEDGATVEIPVPNQTTYECAFVDPSAVAGGRYTYLVRALWQDGTSTVSLAVTVALIGPSLRLEAGPNPSSGPVSFRVSSSRPVETQVLILDVAGHAMATLNGLTGATDGAALVWDGRDRSGHVAPPGVYLIRARSGVRTFKRSIVRVL